MKTDKPNYAVVIIRIMVGTVFLSEGIQKFLYPEIRGVGRFIKIGIPYPEFFGHFVPTFEIVCGVLIVIGLFTRLTAIISSKIPILLNEGFWQMAHAARTDWSMLLGSIFLLIVGAGKYSVDKYLSKKSGEAH